MLFTSFPVISWNTTLICSEFWIPKRGHNGSDSSETTRFLKWNIILLDLASTIIQWCLTVSRRKPYRRRTLVPGGLGVLGERALWVSSWPLCQVCRQTFPHTWQPRALTAHAYGKQSTEWCLSTTPRRARATSNSEPRRISRVTLYWTASSK